MQFTREPLVETIIIPKEGFKLLVRSTKQGGSEDFYVDSVQVILIGGHCFYRSIEKPKAFVLPASDYEVIEVKEARLQLKMPGKEMTGIKIAGGRETTLKANKESKEEVVEEKGEEETLSATEIPEPPLVTTTPSQEKHRDRKRRRFRKGRKEDVAQEGGKPMGEEKPPSLIPPPPTLISETIARYKDVPDFAGAFYEREVKKEGEGTPTSETSSSVEPRQEEPSAPPRQESEDADLMP